jgi:Domain of unknown function (DUF4252)
MRTATILFALALAPACAQEIRMPAGMEKLAAKAQESVDVTLDSHMLKMASQVLSSTDKDQAKAKKLLAGLENLTVRSYQFGAEGEYSPADLDAIRAQLKMPEWSRIVGVKSKAGDNADVYIKVTADGIIGGVVVIAAEPKEFTFVSITGRLDLAQLAELGGHYHIPELDPASLGGLKGIK